VSPPASRSPVEPSSDPRRRRVVKRRLRVLVTFASSAGTTETLEGPVAHEAGDAIVTGVADEQWPVPRATFFARYRPVEGVQAGDDGVYESLPEPAWAVRLDKGDAPLHVVTRAGAVLLAVGGDWIVERDSGDVHVVNGDLFTSLYEECS
jgi:hypothetical protein